MLGRTQIKTFKFFVWDLRKKLAKNLKIFSSLMIYRVECPAVPLIRTFHKNPYCHLEVKGGMSKKVDLKVCHIPYIWQSAIWVYAKRYIPNRVLLFSYLSTYSPLKIGLNTSFMFKSINFLLVFPQMFFDRPFHFCSSYSLNNIRVRRYTLSGAPKRG